MTNITYIVLSPLLIQNKQLSCPARPGAGQQLRQQLIKYNQNPSDQQFYRSLVLLFRIWFCSLIFLSGDIELNPGPCSSFNELIGNLKLCLINCQDLRNKHDQLRTLVSCTDNNTIIALTETWFNNDDCTDLWTIDKARFKIFRCDRNRSCTGQSKGGGVMMLIPKHMNPTLKEDLNFFRPTYFEGLWIQIYLRKSREKILICTAYNPNKNYIEPFLEDLSRGIDYASSKNAKLIVCGDFNYNTLNTKSNLLNDTLIPYGITPTNKTMPTRISTVETLIDHVFIEKSYHKHVTIEESPINSDHLATFVVTKWQIPEKQQALRVQKFDKSHYHKEKFLHELNNADWTNVYKQSTTEGMLREFENVFSQILENHAPLTISFTKQKKTSKNKPLWITKEFELESAKKSQYFREMKENKLDPSIYRAQRNICSNLAKKLKNAFDRRLFNSLDCSTAQWKFINQIRQSKAVTEQILILRNSFGNVITQSKNIANHLNYIFSTLGDFRSTKTYSPPEEDISNRPETKNNFEFSPITEKELFDVLKSLKRNKPLGPSKIPAWAIKDAQSIIAPHLLFIINQGITDNSFPFSLKKAEVTPVFKKGDPSLAENYRPISVTSALAKVFEKVLYNQILDYLQEHKLLSDRQFGFRKHYSTRDALLYVTETIRNSIDKGLIVGATFIDLSKAFDSICHSILMKKLTKLNFGPNSVKLLGNYLTNRTQRVKVNGLFSDWIELHRGVPQGTILGPLCFLIYVNDMISEVDESVELIQYADDTTILCAAKNINTVTNSLEKNISKLSKYFEINHLKMNVDKTKFVLFGTQQKCSKVSETCLEVNSEKIQQSKDAKFLGVTLDQTLSFKTHINSLLKKMAVAIKAIQVIRNQVPLKTRITLLKSLVLSQLTHSSLLCCNLQQQLNDSINKQIKWGLKVCYYKGRRESSKTLRDQNLILLAPNYFLVPALCYFALISNQLIPAFKNSIRIPNSLPKTNRRTQLRLLPGKARTTYLQNSFIFTCIRAWNDLPLFIKNTELTVNYKRKIKSRIKNHIESKERLKDI